MGHPARCLNPIGSLACSPTKRTRRAKTTSAVRWMLSHWHTLKIVLAPATAEALHVVPLWQTGATGSQTGHKVTPGWLTQLVAAVQ